MAKKKQEVKGSTDNEEKVFRKMATEKLLKLARSVYDKSPTWLKVILGLLAAAGLAFVAYLGSMVKAGV